MVARERAPENGHPDRRPCPDAGLSLVCRRPCPHAGVSCWPAQASLAGPPDSTFHLEHQASRRRMRVQGSVRAIQAPLGGGELAAAMADLALGADARGLAVDG